MFVLFLVLIVGPIIASKFISVNFNVFNLVQPDNWHNNDTLNATQTGTVLNGAGTAAATATASVTAKRMAYLMY